VKRALPQRTRTRRPSARDWPPPGACIRGMQQSRSRYSYPCTGRSPASVVQRPARCSFSSSGANARARAKRPRVRSRPTCEGPASDFLVAGLGPPGPTPRPADRVRAGPGTAAVFAGESGARRRGAVGRWAPRSRRRGSRPGGRPSRRRARDLFNGRGVRHQSSGPSGELRTPARRTCVLATLSTTIELALAEHNDQQPGRRPRSLLLGAQRESARAGGEARGDRPRGMSLMWAADRAETRSRVRTAQARFWGSRGGQPPRLLDTGEAPAPGVRRSGWRRGSRSEPSRLRPSTASVCGVVVGRRAWLPPR
jgi:hypothetical protein